MTFIHYRKYYETDTERIHGLFDRWLAKCDMYHLELHATHGRNQLGGKHQYYVFAPDWIISHWQEYKAWRIGLKCWSDQEAIQSANTSKRVEQFAAQIWRYEFQQMMAEG